MTTYPNLGLTLPLRGSVGSGHWSDTLDDDLARIDAHDHQPGKGLRIRSLALNIDGDVSFGSSWAVTALNRASFSSVAPPTVNRSVFVSDGTGGLTANELYWRSNAGAQVKLTSGSTLNVAAFVGGIGGDYQAVGAQLNYDDAAKRYTCKEGTLESNGWAKLQAGTLRLTEFNTTETVFVEQACPAALAVSYTMTWPTALPGSSTSKLFAIDSTGQIAFVPASLPAGKTILQIDAVGAVTAALAVPGATSYVTMDSSGVLGTKPVSVTWQHSAALALLGDATATVAPGTSGSSTSPRFAFNTSLIEHTLPLTIPVGTITGFSVKLSKTTTSGTVSAKLFEAAGGGTGGTPTQIGATQSNSANNPGDVTLSQSGLSFAMTATRQYYIIITGGGNAGDIVHSYNAAVLP